MGLFPLGNWTLVGARFCFQQQLGSLGAMSSVSSTVYTDLYHKPADLRLLWRRVQGGSLPCPFQLISDSDWSPALVAFVKAWSWRKIGCAVLHLWVKFFVHWLFCFSSRASHKSTQPLADDEISSGRSLWSTENRRMIQLEDWYRPAWHITWSDLWKSGMGPTWI